MDNHCITCSWCDHSEGHVCTLGVLPIDDPYSDRCESYTAKDDYCTNKSAILMKNDSPYRTPEVSE